MTSLYEYFGCETREELYKLVKEDDISVRSLVDFIEFTKADLNKGGGALSSPHSLVEYVNDISMPSRSEVVTIFVSTKLEPLHLGRFDTRNKEGFKMMVKEGLEAGGVSVFLIQNASKSVAEKNEIINDFELFGLNVVDSFDYRETENALYSHEEASRQGVASPHYLKEGRGKSKDYGEVTEGVSYEEYSRSVESITTLKGYDEFSSYYAKQEILGLNIFEDNILIKENLKVGYQYDYQESFGLIGCNADGEVVLFEELFKGSPNFSVVDRKVLLKEILSRDDIKLISVFHNHPSGNPNPSMEDVKITQILTEMCEKIDVDMLDHFVIGEKYVYSFAKEESEVVSENQKYKRALKRQSNKKFRQQSFDLGL